MDEKDLNYLALVVGVALISGMVILLVLQASVSDWADDKVVNVSDNLSVVKVRSVKANLSESLNGFYVDFFNDSNVSLYVDQLNGGKK